MCLQSLQAMTLPSLICETRTLDRTLPGAQQGPSGSSLTGAPGGLLRAWLVQPSVPESTRWGGVLVFTAPEPSSFKELLAPLHLTRRDILTSPHCCPCQRRITDSFVNDLKPWLADPPRAWQHCLVASARTYPGPLHLFRSLSPGILSMTYLATTALHYLRLHHLLSLQFTIYQ